MKFSKRNFRSRFVGTLTGIIFSAVNGLLLISAAAGQSEAPVGTGGLEKRLLKVTSEEKREFRDFLKGKHTGIVKLWNDPCGPALVVDAGDRICAGRSDAAFGSHYSFFAQVYFEKYQHVDYATVSLTKGEFVVKNNARLAQLLVDLGAREIGASDRETREVIDFREFPLFDKSARQKFNNAGNGYEFRGLRMTNRQKAALGRTFLLRSVFSEGIRSLTGARRETLFVFEAVRQEGELLTILWKELYSVYI